MVVFLVLEASQPSGATYDLKGVPLGIHFRSRSAILPD